MDKSVIEKLKHLTTPHLADGCLRTGLPIRCAPTGLQGLVPGMQCAGRARPVRHVGSIDVYFEAIEGTSESEVLVVDNGGRLDEACVGDIVALEVKASGISGIVIWGLHRDSKELTDIGFPLFSLGALPTGPQRLNPRPADMFSRAIVGSHVITSNDFVVADANGVLFLPEDNLERIVDAASEYRDIEARQLKAMAEGRSYRDQTRFGEYTARRRQDPSYGFRQHLKDIEAAGEV